MKEVIFWNDKSAAELRRYSTHISQEDPEETFFMIFRSLVSISDSKSSTRNGSDDGTDLSELAESESEHEPFLFSKRVGNEMSACG